MQDESLKARVLEEIWEALAPLDLGIDYGGENPKPVRDLETGERVWILVTDEEPTKGE